MQGCPDVARLPPQSRHQACYPAGAPSLGDNRDRFRSLLIPCRCLFPQSSSSKTPVAGNFAGATPTWELTLESTLVSDQLCSRWESALGRPRGLESRTFPRATFLGLTRHPRVAAAPGPEFPASRPQVVAPHPHPAES